MVRSPRITLVFATSGHSVLHQFESNSYLFKEVPANHRDSLKKGKKDLSPCFTCGDKHCRNSCKLRNAQCHFCKKIGHIEKVCRKKHNNRRSFLDCSDSDAALQSNEPSRRPNVKTLRFAEPAPGYSNGDLLINTIRVSDPPHAACSSSFEDVHHSHRAPTRTISPATTPTIVSVAADPYPANTSQPANLSATSIPTIYVDAVSTSNVSAADDSCYSATASLISTEHLAPTEVIVKEYDFDNVAQSILKILSNAAPYSKCSFVNGLTLVNDQKHIPAVSATVSPLHPQTPPPRRSTHKNRHQSKK